MYIRIYIWRAVASSSTGEGSELSLSITCLSEENGIGREREWERGSTYRGSWAWRMWDSWVFHVRTWFTGGSRFWVTGWVCRWTEIDRVSPVAFLLTDLTRCLQGFSGIPKMPSLFLQNYRNGLVRDSFKWVTVRVVTSELLLGHLMGLGMLDPLFFIGSDRASCGATGSTLIFYSDFSFLCLGQKNKQELEQKFFLLIILLRNVILFWTFGQHNVINFIN